METLVKLFVYIKPYKSRLVLAALFNLLLAIFTVVTIPAFIPFFQILFDTQASTTSVSAPGILQEIKSFFGNMILTQGKPAALVYVCLFILLATFFKNLFKYLSQYMMSPLRTGIIRDIREKLYDKILQLPLTYFSNERKGDLMSRMTNDVTEIEWSVITTVEALFREPIILIGSLAFMIYVSPALTGIVFLLMIVIGYLIGGVSRRLKKQSQEAQDQLGLVNSTLEETIGGVRIIKGFNAEPFMMNRFKKENDGYRVMSWNMLKRRDLASPLSEFLGVTAVIVLLYVGSKQVFAHQISPEIFLTFIFAFYSVIDPSKALSQAWFNLQKASAALNRIEQVLNTPNDIQNQSNPIVPNGFNHAIQFKNVSFRYQQDQSWVLRNINLEIPKGKTVALVGRSGSGKSTMVDLLPRFYDVTEGEILIDGVNIKSMDLSALRQMFAIVTQEAILFHGSIEDNIRFGSEAPSDEIREFAQVAHAAEFIGHAPGGYASQIGDRGQKLSGGQRQRLTLARALLRKSPLLILDEATSALDSESEKLIQNALDKVLPDKTAIVIAHRLNTIKQADLIVVLEDGAIVQVGTHNELITQGGVYHKMLEQQV
ncbi:MAG: ABC transporter ATP-binding protein [Saprospiraceae bacterium]|jgi:subfamily B ATP-binding cassette protein MsbA|nr:ABC transporter ATP-binding protein [Saprospiraceae bacterium]MBK8513985.1 ABC transporter ATP-binding protein [Saprospiraceae bacterium]MBK8776565.1 ABC transporter ATP-binding protein [Saprospiraceae bacterium]MBK9680716.1 ABC transporter ATP-binding protein [Saprospiraceae bacterium]